MTDLFSLPPEVEQSDMISAVPTGRSADGLMDRDRTAAPLARSTDKATSHAAAAAAKRFIKDHHAAIVGALFIEGTCHDIARRTGLDHVAVARRMKELVDSGQVRDTGKTAAGPNGRLCTVYDQVVVGSDA